jgi:hypothetical protein
MQWKIEKESKKRIAKIKKEEEKKRSVNHTHPPPPNAHPSSSHPY